MKTTVMILAGSLAVAGCTTNRDFVEVKGFNKKIQLLDMMTTEANLICGDNPNISRSRRPLVETKYLINSNSNTGVIQCLEMNY